MKSKKLDCEHAGKTILVVDDELAILDFVTLVLNSTGFEILTAQSGEDAMRQSRAYKKTIHVLLSNIQMKGISGIELSTRLTLERPEMKVLLMSGFTDGMLLLDEGWHFLHKPFIPAQLRELIASVMKSMIVPDINEHA